MADKELYKKLREKYTDEELAESFVFPHGLAEEEKKKADKEDDKEKQKEKMQVKNVAYRA